MDYRILLQKENDAVRERYELSMERIRSMDTEEMGLPYGCYFKKVSAFIRRIERLAKRVEETGFKRGGRAGGDFFDPGGAAGGKLRPVQGYSA